jgi:hypothetical protein
MTQCEVSTVESYFRSSRLKVRRADELCDALRDEMWQYNDFHKQQLVAVRLKDHWSVRLGDALDIPESWTTTISEVLFHLRSALDHMVYELATAVTGHSQDRDKARLWQFPIVTEPNKFRRAASEQLGGIDHELWPLFEYLQPFPARVGRAGTAILDNAPELLRILNELHRHEKHRFPHIAVQKLNGTTRAILQPEPVVDLSDGRAQIAAGMEIARMPFADGYEPDVRRGQPRFSFAPEISLNGESFTLPHILVALKMTVSQILDRFVGAMTNPSTRAALLQQAHSAAVVRFN